LTSPTRFQAARPFQLYKFLSWSSLALILGMSLFLSVFITNNARQMVLKKHQQFALLLADNLNNQIYQRFTLPALVAFGRIQLKDERQYNQLDKVIKSVIHSFNVLDVRIYDSERVVSYATNRDLVGKEGLADVAVDRALDQVKHSFEVKGKKSMFYVLFSVELDPQTFLLRTVYPLRAGQPRSGGSLTGPVMGALEFTQDITSDYESIVHFQVIIVLASFGSALVLFLLLKVIIRRADRILAERIAEKERLERELHQNEKLASMGRMVASIAHEFRNPLGIIRSSSELLLKKTRPEENANYKLLKAVYDESKRLSQTVGDFLDYARPKPPRRDQLDLAEVLDQAVTFLEPECNKQGVSIDKKYQPGLIIRGDKDLLYRAVYNIMINALQAMDGGGKITIESERKRREIDLVFTDTGPGFDPQTKDKLLDPFYTTKEMGTGLGLAIVNNILDSHGAGLELENAEPRGARVTATFKTG